MKGKKVTKWLAALAVGLSVATATLGLLPIHGRAEPSLWLPAGILPSSDKPTGLLAGRQHLWMLVQTPATATRPAGYRGEADSLDSLSIGPVTPYLPSAGPLAETAWGRTARGYWWVVFTGVRDLPNGTAVRVVRTAMWRPGQSTWSRLPSLTLSSSDNNGQAPKAVIVDGKLGHGWLVSHVADGNQTMIYRLSPHGWHKIRTLSYSSQPAASSFHWAVAGPIDQLFLKPAGADLTLWVNANGRILKTTPIPPVLSRQMQAAFDNAPQIAVSNGRITYFASTATGSLWRWVGSRVEPLTGSQSPLASDVILWQGIWHNLPVVTAVNSHSLRQMVYIFRGSGWHPAPDLIRYSAAIRPLGSHNPAYYIFWSGNTFWTITRQHMIYVHRVTLRSFWRRS